MTDHFGQKCIFDVDMLTTPPILVEDTAPESWASNDRVDLIALALLLWVRRWVILGATLGAGVLFLGLGFVLPKEYESTILLLPTETPKTDQLGAAAALLGKKNSSGLFDLELYQALLTSRTVIFELLRSEIPNLSDTGRGRLEPLFQIIKIDTLKPGALFLAQEMLAKKISVENLGSGSDNIIQVKVKASEAWLAQELAERTVAIGQEAVRRVRIDRFQTILPRLLIASETARREWDDLAQKSARFKGANRSIILPEQQYQLDGIQMEKQLKESKYVMARREVEQILLEQEKAAPPAMILDKASLPPWKSKPKRGLLCVIGMFLGFAISSASIAAWSLLEPELRRRI